MPANTDLAESAFKKLLEIISENFEKAMYDAGDYLIKTFYDGNIELARKKESPEKGSLNQLIKRLQSNSEGSPSKSWIYNSIGLIVQESDIKQLGEKIFHTYGKLFLSHKTHLLDVKNIDKKLILIKEIADKNLSVRALEERKKELIPNMQKKKSLLTLLNVPDQLFNNNNKEILSQKNLSELSDKRLSAIKDKTILKFQSLEKEISKHNEKIKLQKSFIKKYQKLANDIDKLIETKS